MRVFITGAQGFVGKNLIALCKKRGIQTIGLDMIGGYNQNCFQADIRSKSISKFIPKNVDAIIHLAALSKDPYCKNKAYHCFDINVMGTLNLMDIAVEKKVKQFIFASSEWVYDSCGKDEIKTEDSVINIANHTSEYALSKLVSEANLRQKYQHGFCPVTILRFGIIYGKRKDNWSAVESIFNTVRYKNQIVVGSLKTGRYFIHVSDITSGIILSIGLKGFDIFNLCGDRLITLGNILGTSKRLLKKTPQVIEKNPKDFNVRLVSNKKSKRILKWKPQIDLEKGLKTLI
jgi:nucleoside-diphosphate-sugar epimerase